MELIIRSLEERLKSRKVEVKRLIKTLSRIPNDVPRRENYVVAIALGERFISEAMQAISLLQSEKSVSVSDTSGEVLGLHEVTHRAANDQDVDSSMVSDESALPTIPEAKKDDSMLIGTFNYDHEKRKETFIDARNKSSD